LSNLRIIPEAQASTYILSNFNIKDVDLDKQSLLINLDSPTLVTISDSSFQRISNVLMLLNIKKVEQGITMTNCYFDNITSADIKHLKDVSPFIQNTFVGLCATFTESDLFLKNATFKTISYSCLSLIRSNFVFEKIKMDYELSNIKPFQAWLVIDKVGPMITLDDVSSGQIVDSIFENHHQYQVKQGAVK